ncbi:hypothetical protein IEQ34_017093 [Dendrobium chrysotoxum]|uniref:Calcium-transporting ATPase n=1 Tax=Dendrobium chrysotoxum TaxID=161865 RepID=A0AAV7GAA8_DENCH|nr:hypothetical protein IEQ34_017093 [Dendrobium chrysotoxum]
MEQLSPSRYQRHCDEEIGNGGGTGGVEGDVCVSYDAFDIPPKNVPIERLRRWRQAALVLNASRRFRYTLDLKKEEEKEQLRRKIRAHAQVIRAAFLFKEAGEREAPGGSVFIIYLHLLYVKGLSNLLKTNLDKGIVGSNTELLHRRNAFGANTYPQKKGRNFLVFLWEACQDLTLVILIVAAVISLVLGIKTEGVKEGWYDGGSIAFAVILVILVTVNVMNFLFSQSMSFISFFLEATSDYKQSLQFQNLNEEKRNIHLEVIRGGRRVEISIFDIVVGDLVPLKIGDQVPADGVLISGHSLAVDESSLTGESKIVHKDLKMPFLMSGCKVADGYGTMLVTAVGINTEWGLLMASISEDSGEETPLQVRLNGVATLIGIVGLSVAAFVLVVLMARYFTGHTKKPDGSVQFIKGQTSVKDAINGAVKILTIAVTIVVVAVPEGLPLAVTLTLAYSMRKMMADKALVRRLSACETMGSATTICSDKTGTLTLNEMTVVEAHVGGMKLAASDDVKQLSSSICSLLIEGISQNTTGSVYEPENGAPSEVTGSPTEKAILSWGIKLGMKFDDARSKTSILHVFPFNSEKKRGGVAVHEAGSEVVHVHWKGAAEIVLASCTSWMDSHGHLQEMNSNQIDSFKKVIEDMAALSLRCVALAYRLHEMENVPREQERDSWALPENDLILLGIVGIKDPCRPGVRAAVELCTNAGVKVRMVTGDNLQTAKAIALDCGILDSEEEATEPTLIEGKVFRALSEKAREEIAEKISVMGRSSPNDKLLLVQALRKKGHVVAVTGDGTNDAPALHDADIGLAMGIQGTEVAKESSDIIILDDNFASVVKVVRWGRSVYANIQKFIQFQLTVNVAALVINVVAAVSSGEVPLNAVEPAMKALIAKDLLRHSDMNVKVSIASCLSGITPNAPYDDDIMKEIFGLIIGAFKTLDEMLSRSFSKRVSIFETVAKLLWVNLIMDTLGALALATEPPTDHLMKRPPVGRREPLITNIMWRNLIVQIFNEFNARKPDEMNVFTGVTKNHLFMGIIGITLVLQIVIIEFLGKFSKTVRLSWKLWMVSIGIAFLSWPLAVAGKLIPVPNIPLGEYFRRCLKIQRKESQGVESLRPGES